MPEMTELIELLQVSNTNEHDNVLSEICRRTKSYDNIEELFNLSGCEALFPFLRSETEGIVNKALSVFANCTNLDEKWRKAVSKFLYSLRLAHDLGHIFKNGPSKICGRQPLKILK